MRPVSVLPFILALGIAGNAALTGCMRRLDSNAAPDALGRPEPVRVRAPAREPDSAAKPEEAADPLSGFDLDPYSTESGKDRFGNPAASRNGTPVDPETGYPREVLLKNPPMEFVLVPAGEFMMGSPESEAGRSSFEGPRHLVRITKPFYLSKYEVTQAQWKAVMGHNPSKFKGDDLPVEQVSWTDCTEFVRKLNKTVKGLEFRLPSEAQWEYACRAGTTGPFHFGPSITSDQANYDGGYPYGASPKGVFRGKTVRVGSFPANPFGLHDMHGNVWEWCEDAYEPRFYEKPEALKPDPLGDSDSSFRVLRGGAWDCFAGYCRSAFRGKDVPLRSFCTLGFRVARPLR
jgi:formylglycine-generating enzyme required for sulfatase activity